MSAVRSYADRGAPATDLNPFRSLTQEQRRGVIARARRIDARSKCAISRELVSLYRIEALRGSIISLATRLEGGRYFSRTLREISRVHHQVEVGMYGYGRSINPGYYPPGSTVGNFGSAGADLVRHFQPLDCPGQHPLFHDSSLGLVEENSASMAPRPPIHLGHDVYIGVNATLLPSCSRIGDGAVVGTSAVLVEDVPPYTIVAGNPAKVIRRRFPEEVEAMIRESRWYLRSLSELVEDFDAFINPASVQSMERLLSVLKKPEIEERKLVEDNSFGCVG